jgi:hypothetical protein
LAAQSFGLEASSEKLSALSPALFRQQLADVQTSGAIMYHCDLFAPANKLLAIVLIVILCDSAESIPRHLAVASEVQSPLKTNVVTPSRGKAGKDYDLVIIAESPGCEAGTVCLRRKRLRGGMAELTGRYGGA